MAQVGFVGLGNMGNPMAANLVRAGHAVKGFDLSETSIELARENGVTVVQSQLDVLENADVVITMLPAGQHAKAVYLGANGLLAKAHRGTLFIDCSTIDVASSREIHAKAESHDLSMLDAPVSGGVIGAETGKLTFMVGGSTEAFEKARPFLDIMGGRIIHAGGAGNGQAAKICNNMILGISMVAVSEAFNLAEALGLDARTFFDISSSSSGSCWAMTTHNPVPGIVEGTASSNNYEAGFAANMMLKDLGLAQMASDYTDCPTPMGAEARAIYQMLIKAGQGDKDYASVIKMLKGELS